MASLATHFSATLFLLPTGVIRLLSSSSLYLKNPSLFRSKTWYLSDPKWKNLDLYVLTISLPFACFSEIFLFLSYSGHSTYGFSLLNKSLVLFLYWALTILFLFRDNIDHFVVTDSFLFVFAGIVFFVEYSGVGKGISGIVGGVVYEFLGDLNFVCGCCCLYLSIRPSSFFAEFCLSCGLVFKGSWFLQSGLCLYTDAFVFKGCHKVALLSRSKNAEFLCDLEEDGWRGVALVHLLFVGHAIGVLLFSFGVFGLLSSNKNSKCGDSSGQLLEGLESQSSWRAPPEFELH